MTDADVQEYLKKLNFSEEFIKKIVKLRNENKKSFVMAQESEFMRKMKTYGESLIR